MKKLKIKGLFLGVFLISAVLIDGCKDPCKDVKCLNGGTCDDGSCNCPAGYSGANCENYNACWNVTCLNGGTCDADGNCDCPDGYEGEDCGIVSADKFIGTWDASESCTQGGDNNYVITVTQSDTAIGKINIDNFGDYGSGVSIVEAKIAGVDITIDSQIVAGFTFAGSGSIDTSGTVISLSFTTADTASIDTCVASFTKQ